MPSGTPSASTETKSKRGPAARLKDTARYSIDKVAADGKPLEPPETYRKFVNQCGVVVRDLVPINLIEWNKPKTGANVGATYVDDRLKRVLCDTVWLNFSVAEDKKKKVEEWALKKMATQFQRWKKDLWKKYKDEDPVFTGHLVKIRDAWPDFKAYKKSGVFTSRSATNTENAKKKKYHHILGSGGYMTALPRWRRYEDALLKRNIIPQTHDWPDRSKFWLFAHGATLDAETGMIVAEGPWSEKIRQVVSDLEKAIEAVRKGTFVPDRENDELTKALGNPEKWGRTRGFGATTPWNQGFPADLGTYRSRGRSKRKALERISTLEEKVAFLLKKGGHPVPDTEEEEEDPAPDADQQQLEDDPVADVVPSQHRSTVGSTQLQLEDGPAVEPSAPHYPVDDVTEKTNCEIHMPMGNISFMVASGYALPNQPGATYHGGQIPASHARVGLSTITPGCQSIELDIPGGEGEKTLGEMELGIILWKKKHIVFPNAAPRPPTPPGTNAPPPTITECCTTCKPIFNSFFTFVQRMHDLQVHPPTHLQVHPTTKIGSPRPRVHRPCTPVSRRMRPLRVRQSGSCSSEETGLLPRREKGNPIKSRLPRSYQA